MAMTERADSRFAGACTGESTDRARTGGKHSSEASQTAALARALLHGRKASHRTGHGCFLQTPALNRSRGQRSPRRVHATGTEKRVPRDLLPIFIAGPCAIESRAFALETAEELKGIFAKANLPFVYKSSFDKANRSSASGFRGVGMDEGLSILDEVRRNARRARS